MSTDTSLGTISNSSARWSRRWGRLRLGRLLAAIAVLAVGMTLGAVPVAHAAGTPTLVSDKADYPPGGVVVLSGAGWASDEVVHITVNDTIGNTWQLDSGQNGAPADPQASLAGEFTYQFTLPAWFVSDYTAKATGQVSGLTATTTFTDAPVGSYRACKNDDGTGGPSDVCDWANGNVQGTNSTYAEGDAVPQRLELIGLQPGASYTLEMSYSVYKVVHTYDYLATYDYSENWITNACAGVSPCSLPGSTYPIPNDPNVPFDGGQVWTMSGGTLTGSTFVGVTAGAGGNWVDGAKNTISVTFTATSSTSVLFWGTHIASGADWGPGRGAASSSGSDFHMYLDALTTGGVRTTLGQADNQMATTAIQAIGHITVIKDAVPDSAQDFGFSLVRSVTGATTLFSLDDDADTTLPRTRTFDASPGTWTVTENALTSPWTLTNLTCSGGAYTKTGSTATLTVVSGQTITCTYTNSYKHEDLTVAKTAKLSFDRDYSWAIDKKVDKTQINTTAGGTATFNYTVVATPTAKDSNAKVSGRITVTNPNNVPVPAVTLTESLSGCTMTPVSGASTASGFTVAANGTAVFDYVCPLASVPTADVNNTATVTWTAGNPYGTSGTASGSATAAASAATITTTNQTILVTDDKTNPASPVVLGTADALVPDTQKYTYSLTKTAPAGTCDSYTNTAWLGPNPAPTTPGWQDSETVTVCGASALVATKSAAATYTRDWAWGIAKDTDKTTLYADPISGDATANYTVTITPTATDSAWKVSGSISVTNPNSISIDGVTLTDSLAGCVIDNPNIGTLAVGETVSRSYTCSYASRPTGTITNTATVSWAASQWVAAGSTTVSAAAVTFDGLAPTTVTGDPVTVTDPKAPPGTFNNPYYGADGPKTVSYNVIWHTDVIGSCETFNNTASITGGLDASVNVSVCRAADLTVTKDGAGTFDRTYKWKIEKALGDHPGAAPAGTSVEWPYTVSVSPDGYTDSGWTLSGTVTVTNPNDFEPITATLSDSLTGMGGTCTLAETSVTLAAKASKTIGYTCTFTQAPTAYAGTNTATATWDKAKAHTASDSAVRSVDVSLTLKDEPNKTVTVTDNGVTLGQVTYADGAKDFSVTRTWTAPDGTCTDVTNTATITETGQTDSATGRLCGGMNLTVSKTAVAGYTQTYPWTIAKDASRTAIVVAEGGDTSVAYTVKPVVGSPYPSAWTLKGTITVSNPNDWETINATVTDEVDIDGLTCTIDQGTDPVSVPPRTAAGAGSVTLNYTCTVDNGANPGTLSGINTATATWNMSAAATASGSANGTADVIGSLTGSVNDTITVTDTLGGDTVVLGTASATGGLTATGAGVTVTDGAFVYTKTLSGVPGQCTNIDNTATITQTDQTDGASVQLCIVKAPTVTKTAAGTFTRTYSWTVEKSAADTQVEVAPDGSAVFDYTVKAIQGATADSGWAMTGTVTVTNPNAFPISATVTDQVTGCTVANGGVVTVAANDSADVAVTCTGLSAPVTSNTASVAWAANSAAGDLAGTPVTGTTTSPIVWTEEASVDKSIDVYDNKTGTTPILLGTAAWGDGTTPVKFTYQVSKSGDQLPAAGSCATYDNKAWVKTDANDSSDTEQVEACVGADLKVSKTAVGSYDTTYTWSIDKQVGDYPTSVPAGTTVTLPYTVVVTKTGQIDAGWTVTGTITVTNPNTWQSVTLTDVTDTLSVDGASCTVTGNKTATIAASGTAEFTYTCTYAAPPASYSGTNTATASWDKAAAYTANGSASGTKDYTLALQGETNAAVTVTDTVVGGETRDLGTVAIGQSPKTLTYDRLVTAPSGGCVTVDNTATITQTSQSDGATATVCGYAAVTADKTAAGAYHRDWDWTIAKDAAATRIVADPVTGAATATYTVVVTPSKTDSSAVVSGSVTVHNPNDVAITATVTDKLGDVTCTVTPASVEVPAKGSASVDYSCTLGSVPTGVVTNTATVTWPTTSYVPGGTLTPSAPVDFAAVTPTESDTSVTFTDPNSPAGSYGPFLAKDGVQSTTYAHTWTGVAGTCVEFTNTATLSLGGSDGATVTVCRAAAITAEKSATGAYARDWTYTVDKSGPATRLYADPVTGEVTADYTVVVTPTKHDSGATVTGSITVTNPNDVPLTVTVSDVMPGADCQLTSTDRTLPANGKLTVGYSCTLDAVPTGSVTNTATVSWPATDYVAAGSVTPSASVDFAAVIPSVTNATTTVTDPVAGWAGDSTVVSAGDGSPTTLNYSHTWTVETAGTCQKFDNTATLSTGGSDTVTVEACRGADLKVTKTVTTSYHRDYDWSITKTAKQPTVSTPAGTPVTSAYDIVVTKAGFTDSAWTMTGTITVSNPNTWQSITADVVDVTDIGATCAVTGGTDVVIPAGESVTLDYSCTFASKPAYTGKNTATATWDASVAHTANASALGSADVDFGAPATESDRTITVTDTPAGGPAKTLGTLDYVTAPETTPYSDSITRDGVAGTCTAYDNTASIVETKQSSTATVTICVGKDLTVSKTASGSYTRTYDWTITKSATPATQTIPAGQQATVTYGVTVTPNGYTDSAQALTGTITITNPNDWQDITATVTDVVEIAGVSCSIDEGASVTVPKSGSVTVHYTCSGDYAGDYTGTNTATATWDQTATATPTGSASGTAEVTMTQTSVHDTITVTDTPEGKPTVTLGTRTWADGPYTFPTYSAQFGGVAGTCTTYLNTAAITEIPGRTATASTQVCVGADVTVSKTAAGSFARTYPWTITKVAEDTQVETTPGGDAVFNYTVKATPGTPVDSAWSMGGTITVSNPNDFQPVTVDVTDVPNVGGGAVCTITGGLGVTIPAGGSVDLPYTCTFTGMPSSYSAGTNAATASVTSGTVPNASVTSTPVGVPFTEGVSVDNSVQVYDDKTVAGASNLLGTANWNATGTPVEFTYSVTQKPTAVGDCTAYTNTAWIDLTAATDPTASATVKACVGADLTVTKNGAGTFDRLYKWSIDKTLDPSVPAAAPAGTSVDFPYTVTVTKAGYVDSGWTLTGTITVANPNTWQDITADVTDALGLSGGATCTVAGGTGVVILAAASVTLNYSCTFTSQPAYTGANTATATWDKAKAHTANASASGSANVTLSLKGETNRNITVTDTQYTPVTPWTLDYVTAADSTPFTYTLAHVAKAGSCETFTNTATITETGQSASVTKKLCGGADLVVTKTAATSMTRTYQWKIVKSAPNGTSYGPTLASTVTVPYQVTVSPDGYVDSKWTVAGTITVTNPNDWESVTVTKVEDTLGAMGGTCTVTGGATAVTLTAKGTAGASKTYSYTCTFTSKPTVYSGTNTATATWDKAAASTANGTASGTAPVDFETGTITKVNQVITVTDQVSGSTTVKTLGTVDWFTGIQTLGVGVTKIDQWTFGYSNTYTRPKNGCTPFTNTAKITQTGQISTVTVNVCGPPWIGDGTIGFWQNKNGQALITGGKSTVVNGVAVCNVTSWLRQFAPFQDLSATATCKQVAAYVLNIMKAANASGATMNAMLKAQMLAAALNYYYTTVEPTRNAPYGSLSKLVFDITPWKAAFGGATEMTLLQMLQFASSQSNSGGSIWYGQDKTVQALAKDAFAAINMSQILVVRILP